MDYELIGFIKASKYREDILTILAKDICTPREIADKLNVHISQVSRTLNELVEMKLINVLNPNMKKGRIYSITPLGDICLKSLR